MIILIGFLDPIGKNVVLVRSSKLDGYLNKDGQSSRDNANNKGKGPETVLLLCCTLKIWICITID